MNNKRLYDPKYKCPVCEGTGRIIDESYCDPIEHYKLADSVPCIWCSGAGKVSKKRIEVLVNSIESVLKND